MITPQEREPLKRFKRKYFSRQKRHGYCFRAQEGDSIHLKGLGQSSELAMCFRGLQALTSPAATVGHLLLLFWAPGNSSEFLSSSGQGQGPSNPGLACAKGTTERRRVGQLLRGQCSQTTHPGDAFAEQGHLLLSL